MEESNETSNVDPELYFLITKFLLGGPLKETAKTLLKELASVEVLPRRLDWEGREHAQSFEELNSQFSDVSWRRLASVCEQALRLARFAPSLPLPGDQGTSSLQTLSASLEGSSVDQCSKLTARLSLLSDTLVRPKPKYSSYKQDHSLVRRLLWREVGMGAAAVAGGRGGEALFSPRMLAGLQLQRRTLGHLSAVYCLVFDCTGRYVITGADDLLVKVWSAIDGRLLATLRGAGAEITDVCVSRDGALIAAGSVERLVRVWCLATGAPRAVLHAHAGTITSVHWSPPSRTDVRWLASTSTDGSVAFWTCSADGQFLSHPVQYVERMRPGACHMICAAWSAGGAFLAAGSADHHVRIYAMEQSGPKRVLETAAHGDAVDSVSWAHRGLRFVSGSKDGSAALWTLHAMQWRHVALRTQHADERDVGKRLKVTMVCWDRSDAYVMTAVSDNTVRVWCSRTCTQRRVLRGHSDEAYVLEPHPFLPHVLLSAGHDGQLFVWDAHRGEVLAHFHNSIDGQGDGAIFDAKWGGGAHVAASDSHGHLLLLGLGQGHRLFKQLPTELFFHTDYRPLVRDALGGALDEQTETPPHLMPPPFLVDVEGAPHSPELQRLVPGRENLTLSQLIPSAEARSRLDVMIEELLAGVGGEPRGGLVGGGGVWRGEGVRHTAGSWQRGDPLCAAHSTRPIVSPLSRRAREAVEATCAELNAFEESWYRREMRRRPVMISTGSAPAAPRRRPGRMRGGAARAQPGAAPAPPTTSRPIEEEPPEVDSGSSSDSDSSVRLSVSVHSHSTRSSRATTVDLTDTTSSSSSQYSDWEAGAALAPPARARRRPVAARRYSPSVAPPNKRPTASPANAERAEAAPSRSAELPEAYRVGEWLTAVSPRKAPYHPQMGDDCLYFRLGHQRYFEAVAEKDLYKLNPRDKPWERTHVYDCELVKVVGIKYVIKPPRVACLKLACALQPHRAFTVRYHDMPDVIDFLVLRHQYATARLRRWTAGDRFRCMIDDAWWMGVVLENSAENVSGGDVEGPSVPGAAAAAQWATAAAAQFLAIRVQWDNGEVERLSPWDLEPLDESRLPAEPGGAVQVLPRELLAVLCGANDVDCAPRATKTIAQYISQVMSLSVAEPFVAPVDLQAYPSYALVVPYPIDLATIKARFENMFYRRVASAQFDVRYLASNAEQFNEPHTPIVRQARLVTDLLLHIISNWRDVDVVAKYHELAAAYHSSDDEPLSTTAANKSRRRGGARRPSPARWRTACDNILRELMSSADAGPFREPVSQDQAPDYPSVIAVPMDLGTVRARLDDGEYGRAEQFAADVRLVFSNSRLYNTNKRSRIYSMTVRLSSLFEELWSRVPPAPRRPVRPSRRAPRTPRRVRPTRTRAADAVMNGKAGDSASSDSETLAATSRRVHAGERAAGARADSWDSDVPLDSHRKGKGVGKKSKSSSNSEPVPSTSTARGDELYGASRDYVSSCEEAPLSRLTRSDSDSTSVEVLGNDLAYEDEAHPHRWSMRARKRRRSHGSSSGAARRKPRVAKRTRERFTEGSSSSSWSGSGSAGAGSGARRYESDRSYRPRYSTDDDAPLHLYRQRHEECDDEAGPSNSRRHNGHARSGGVSLRARGSPRRYNEDSEEDSAAAISKRLRAPPHPHPRSHALHAARRRHQQNMIATAAHTNDHNYFNGHASARAHSAHNGSRSEDGSPSASNSASGGAPVSISSRGRVRRLTAKARGLLHD